MLCQELWHSPDHRYDFLVEHLRVCAKVELSNLRWLPGQYHCKNEKKVFSVNISNFVPHVHGIWVNSHIKFCRENREGSDSSCTLSRASLQIKPAGLPLAEKTLVLCALR